MTQDECKCEYRGLNGDTDGTNTEKSHSERGSGQMQVIGRGYTHSIVAGVALRELSCQFSTGTGMQVSLMVS